MKKIFIFLIFTFFLSYGEVGATTSYIPESSRTNCSEDPGIDDNSGKKWIVDTIDYSAATSGTFNCEEHGYWSGVWSSWRAQGTNYNCPANGYASQRECRDAGGVVVACTGNGNGWVEYRVYCKTVDDTPPVITDIRNLFPTDQTYIVADNSRNISFDFDVNGGSPMETIQARIENHSTPGTYQASVTQNNTNTFANNFNVSLVDGSDRTVNNYRPYSFQIQQVCDEAGNCLVGIPYTYTYNVYANNVDIGNSTINIPNNLTSGNAVADGTPKTYSFTLNDEYNNNIIPVRRANNTLLRAVDFIFNHSTHTLGINQYNQSSNSGAVEFAYSSNPKQQPMKGDSSTTFTENTVSNISGIYNIDMTVYTPTRSGYSRAYGDFILDNVQVDLSDMSPTPLDSTSRTLRFKPLYETLFSGELVSQGFKEGILQTSSTQITKNSGQVATNPKLYLEFGSGGLKSSSPDLNLEYGKTSSLGNSAVEGQQSNISFLAPEYHNLAGNQTLSLYTLLAQTGPVLPGLSYLASHIQYQLGGKTISYSSDIIGKQNYQDPTATGPTDAVIKGVKVIGLTSSDKVLELTTDQFDDDIRIIGKVVKSSYRKDISQKVFETLRSMGNWSGTIQKIEDFSGTKWSNSALNTGIKTLDDTVQVFKNIGGEYVALGDGSSVSTTSGVKTLVIIGGDVYIRENITHATSSSLLGIIVLKDASGNGGNVYIHPNVTDIHAVIYADKSLISATDTNSDGIIESTETHGPSTPISTLADQLYIKGSIFSENTIGGSRANPIECPYYTDCVTISQAQQYDLNYIRRYTRIDTDSDTIPDTVANSGTASSGAGTSYPDYPVVIEYNSNLQTNPPPFFY